MSELEVGFRTAVVGGFQRDDVLKYIEELAQSHAKEMETLKNQLHEAETARDAQKKQNDTLAETKDTLQKQLDSVTAELAQTKAELEALRQEVEQADEENTVYTEQYRDLQQERDALQAECDDLRRKNDSLGERAQGRRNITKRATVWRKLSCAPAGVPKRWSRMPRSRRRRCALLPCRQQRKFARKPTVMRTKPAR